MKPCAWGGTFFLLAGGCLPGPESNTLVPTSPFVNHACKPVEVRHDVAAPGSKEASDRVWAVGGRVIAGNPQIGFRPRFSTVGSPKEEIYHHGTREVVITEGLVRRCETDGRLAAVICLELGKMIVERETCVDPVGRVRAERGPVEMPVGNDSGGLFGSPDGTRRMELTKYVEQARHKADSPPPAPENLARGYLSRAGFDPTELNVAFPAPQEQPATSAK